MRYKAEENSVNMLKYRSSGVTLFPKNLTHTLAKEYLPAYSAISIRIDWDIYVTYA